MFYEAINLGPFTLKYGWIAIGYSLLCAYVIMRIRLEKYPFLKEQVTDIFYNSVLIFFFVWKFSIILKNPEMLIHNLYGLLYFSGGIFGLVLGAFAVLVYIIRTYRKKSLPLVPLADVLLFTCLSWWIAYGLHHWLLFRV